MKSRIVLAALLVVATPGTVQAQAAADEDLAKKLANPISSLISVPFQYNFDCCYGPSDADRHLLNIQPVVPTKLTPNWNLIIRTILPVIYLESPAPGLDNTFGLSDTLQILLLAAQHSGRRHMGRGARDPMADRHRSADRQREMECRADRCDLEAARGLDLWHPRQSDLVLRRRGRPQ